ncbi:MAG: glycosyltransferase [Anaerolineae bacterium]|nr:MAG: glycosyltransferase [Anaerolineae bacterium]
MDAYVNPASAEAFGIATVEAMLAGLPTVVANCGALPGSSRTSIPACWSTPKMPPRWPPPCCVC